jgi:hypothetical protein
VARDVSDDTTGGLNRIFPEELSFLESLSYSGTTELFRKNSHREPPSRSG